MNKYLIIVLFASLFAFSSCNYSKPDRVRNNTQQNKQNRDSLAKVNFGLDRSEAFNADVNQEMTLSEVCRKNDISLNYLKAQLGINQNIKHDYKLKQIRRNYKFTINDVKKIISDYHNEKIYKEKNNTK